MSARLVIVSGAFAGRELPLIDGVNVLGRGETRDPSRPEIDLDTIDIDAKVSRRHAQIDYSAKSKEVYIQDLGSLNGVYLNTGQRLDPERKIRLQNNEEILVGNIILRLVLD